MDSCPAAGLPALLRRVLLRLHVGPCAERRVGKTQRRSSLAIEIEHQRGAEDGSCKSHGWEMGTMRRSARAGESRMLISTQRPD